MKKGTYIANLKADSNLAGLFTPDMKGEENLRDAIDSRILLAMPILNSAIRAAREGNEDGGCSFCNDVLELLEAYKAIVWITLDAAETEELRRAKGKAV